MLDDLTNEPAHRLASERPEYRGYEIQLRHEWSNWCAAVHPTRADLPILAQSPLLTLSLNRDEALAAAKRNIDEALGHLTKNVA
ncbi:MAG TPA: hypothetical protein VMW57_00370 [Methyloceanibacter sp.]|nr:hypothetical protein [Methyloceanibacter sp.]